MSRPRKCRTICHMPATLSFFASESSPDTPPITLTLDEFETIRLIDREGLSQEGCAQRMGIARTTVQQIYASARTKIANFLVEGTALHIDGGDITLCDGHRSTCSPNHCYKQRFSKSKGDRIMRIAVTYQNGTIFQHFGHTEQFKIYDVADGKIVASEVVDTNGSGHGALAGVLSALNADILICGGIGGGAQMALASAGIQLYGGVSGSADAAVEALIAGNLAYNPDVQCNHHGHHHGEGHTCGDHGCGSDHHHCGGHH